MDPEINRKGAVLISNSARSDIKRNYNIKVTQAINTNTNIFQRTQLNVLTFPANFSDGHKELRLTRLQTILFTFDPNFIN